MIRKRAPHRESRELFPPWFVPMDVYRRIQAMLPRFYHDRLRLYFDRYGCLRCRRKDRLYCGSGLCMACLPLIEGRLKQVDKLMKKKRVEKSSAPAERFLKGRANARLLLGDLRGKF